MTSIDGKGNTILHLVSHCPNLSVINKIVAAYPGLTFLCNDGLVLPVHLLPKNYLTSRKVMVCSLKREMAAHLTPIGMLLMTSQSSGVYHWVHRE